MSIFLANVKVQASSIVMIIATLFEYSDDMDDIYEKIKEYNPNKNRKILIVFDDIIADMLLQKKLIKSN